MRRWIDAKLNTSARLGFWEPTLRNFIKYSYSHLWWKLEYWLYDASRWARDHQDSIQLDEKKK